MSLYAHRRAERDLNAILLAITVIALALLAGLFA